MVASTKKVWFLTGASSGFGRAMVERVLRDGDIAIATLQIPSAIADLSAKYPPSQLLVLKLDVSRQADIAVAFDAARVAFGRIDVVFNNAAYGVVGDVEGSLDEFVRPMWEVCFWGAANVSRAAVAFFRDVNKPIGGRLLQISSMAGFVGSPGIGYYSASKFAFEGLSEALNAELDPEWNIKIIIAEPGGFRTDGVSRIQLIPPHPAYIKPGPRSVFVRQWLTNTPPLRGDTKKAIDVFVRIAALPDPPLHFPMGKDSIKAIRSKLASMTAELDKYEAWSGDLEIEDP